MEGIEGRQKPCAQQRSPLPYSDSFEGEKSKPWNRKESFQSDPTPIGVSAAHDRRSIYLSSLEDILHLSLGGCIFISL